MSTKPQKDLEEMTAAADSLKPQNTTKSAMLNSLVAATAGMSIEDLSSFLTKTLAQVGKESDSVPDNSGKNKASIAMKPGKTPSPSASTGAVREDIVALFSGHDLTEEFKENTATLFEAAVSNRVLLEVARIEEEYESTINEEVEKQVMENVDELHEQVEKYMNHVAQTWLENNELALESNIRNAVTEKFINGLKDLFQESYIDIPEDRFDVVEELAAALAETEEALENIKVHAIELENEIQESRVAEVFSGYVKDLTETDIEKLKALSESIDYSDLNDYGKKLAIIKGQYFNEETEAKTSTGLINEESIGVNDEVHAEKFISKDMKVYSDAISRSLKK